MAKVDMTDVPGMSPMDVEGLNDQAVANVSTLISLLTVSSLTFYEHNDLYDTSALCLDHAIVINPVCFSRACQHHTSSTAFCF